MLLAEDGQCHTDTAKAGTRQAGCWLHFSPRLAMRPHLCLYWAPSLESLTGLPRQDPELILGSDVFESGPARHLQDGAWGAQQAHGHAVALTSTCRDREHMQRGSCYEGTVSWRAVSRTEPGRCLSLVWGISRSQGRGIRHVRPKATREPCSALPDSQERLRSEVP